MLAAATLASFLSTFGDCFENCEGYFGAWETTARFYRLIGSLGLATLFVALAAMVFRLAQMVLAVIASVILATVALSFLVPLRDLWIPGLDVYAGSFVIVFLIQLPAAAFWLGGATLGLVASRIGPGAPNAPDTRPFQAPSS